MKDQVLKVADALFLAKAELQEFYDAGARDPDRIIDRLHDILFDPSVSEAMQIIAPGYGMPSIVPEQQEFDYADDGLHRH